MFFFLSLAVPALFLALVVNALYLVVRLCSLPFNVHIAYAPFGWMSLGLASLWVLMILYGSLIGRYRSETRFVDYSNSSIPEAFDGYRIVQISDIHLDGWRGHENHLEKLFEKINALQPDLICFTGDLVSISPNEIFPFVNILGGLEARDGVISVLGNHDYFPYSHVDEAKKAENLAELVRIEKEELGWKLLMNEHVVLHRDDDSLAVIGCENQSVGAHSVVVRGDLAKASEGTEGMMRILLAHDPSQWRKEVVGATDVPLTLSGHTHAMQMRLFGWTPSVFLYPECDGLYTDGEQSLYVNIGLGGTLPCRIGAPAEITVIRLSRSQ